MPAAARLCPSVTGPRGSSCVRAGPSFPGQATAGTLPPHPVPSEGHARPVSWSLGDEGLDLPQDTVQGQTCQPPACTPPVPGTCHGPVKKEPGEKDHPEGRTTLDREPPETQGLGREAGPPSGERRPVMWEPCRASGPPRRQGRSVQAPEPLQGGAASDAGALPEDGDAVCKPRGPSGERRECKDWAWS